MVEPKIVHLEELFLVGLPFYGEPPRFGETWMRFMKMAEKITNRINPTQEYGVEIYGPEMDQMHQWTYLPSRAVSDLMHIPEFMFGTRLPASDYAVFTVTGKLARIHDVFMYAYHEWIPASKYEVAFPFDFELYDERFHGDVDDSILDLYIPIIAR